MLFELGRTLAQVKALLKRDVDVTAESLLGFYLTPGSAIAVEYVNTKTDAQRWQADDLANTLGPDDSYPFVYAEKQAQIAAGNGSFTMEDAVTVILAQVALYELGASSIKEQRRTAKLLIDAAATIPAARAAAVVVWTLPISGRAEIKIGATGTLSAA